MPLFQPNTPGFKDTHEIDPSSRDFACLDLCAKRAIASAAKKDVADIVNTGTINVGDRGIGIYSSHNGVMTSVQNNNMNMTTEKINKT